MYWLARNSKEVHWSEMTKGGKVFLMEQLREEVVANIRACLISVKGKISTRQLEADYRTLLGERVPYEKLRFKNLETFLSSIPSLSVTKSSNGEYFVDAKASEKTNHISDLVSRQKSKPRKFSKSVKFNYARNNAAQHAAQTQKWRPVNQNYRSKDYKSSPRFAAVSHNQLVNNSPPRSLAVPTVASRVTIPVHSTLSTVSKKILNDKVQQAIVTNKPKNIMINRTLRQSNGNDDEGARTVINEDKSELHSAKKRLTKKISEMSISERDSGNSSPISDSKPILPSTEIVLTGDPINDLKNIVAIYKIEDLEIIHHWLKHPKGRYEKLQSTINCTIIVDGNTYLSYPNDFYDEKSAQEYCARKALDELVPKYSKKKTMLLSTSKDIKERIPPMLLVHFQPVWSWQIEEDYSDKYKEQLPNNWLEIVDSCDCVAIEKLQERHILHYCKPGMKGQTPTASMAVTDVSVPANTVQFGDTGALYALITCAMSLNEIWCRQWDIPDFDLFNEMVLRMEPYYTLHKLELKTDIIQAGSYYAAFYDNNWFRVRALEVNEREVNCFLIDSGDEYLIERENIYNLKREFATCQAQAFVCRLAGLEDLYESAVDQDYLLSFVGVEVILENANEDAENANDDPSLPVAMYNYQDGHSINEELISFMTIQSALPVLKKDKITDVFVSNIEKNGDIYIQIHSLGFASLRTLLNNLEAEVIKKPPMDTLIPLTKSNSKDKMYFGKCKTTKQWHRIKIIDWSPKGDMAQIYFVDHGHTDVIKVAGALLFPLESISDVISKFPEQAVRVKMDLEKIPVDFVEQASKLMPKDTSILLKIILEDKIPLGEFYKHSPDIGLFCINKSIAMEAELKNDGDGNNNFKGTRRKLVQLAQFKELPTKHVPSGGSLQRPELPKKGEFFNVYVPLSVNPWNFFVQPFQTKLQLANMMKELQERYKDVTYSPLHIGAIIPGQIYASKHDDDMWYRTSIIKVIHTGSISVFLCDFGYYSSLRLDQLVPLDPYFMTLPYQALKAKIAGIAPKKSKWSVEDCEFFTALVYRRSFVSVLIDTEEDELYESDIVLKLTLIDTSSTEDIFIDQELVKENIAVAISS